MRVKSCIWIFLIMFGALGSAAQSGSSSGEQFLGTWVGTWDGAGTGGFELTLEKGDAGAVAGRVSVTGEPTYKAVIKTLSFDGMTMKGKYDFPPDERAEIGLTVTFDGKTAKGTWLVTEKASGTQVATGSLSLTKK